MLRFANFREESYFVAGHSKWGEAEVSRMNCTCCTGTCECRRRRMRRSGAKCFRAADAAQECANFASAQVPHRDVLMSRALRKRAERHVRSDRLHTDVQAGAFRSRRAAPWTAGEQQMQAGRDIGKGRERSVCGWPF
jgi:hypothetical protein